MAKVGPYEPDAFTLDTETLVYELERFGATIYFDPTVLHQIKMDSYRHHATDMLTTQIMGMVAMWREERMLKVPANWWEHLKQRWYPQWALKRWPVLYVWHDAAVILPKVPLVNPSYHTVEFAVWRRSKE